MDFPDRFDVIALVVDTRVPKPRLRPHGRKNTATDPASKRSDKCRQPRHRRYRQESSCCRDRCVDGVMGRATDQAGIHFRVLISKGPAVEPLGRKTERFIRMPFGIFWNINPT